MSRVAKRYRVLFCKPEIILRHETRRRNGEIRNPNIEARNKFKILISKGSKHFSTQIDTNPLLFQPFGFWSFDIVSDFVLRASDFI